MNFLKNKWPMLHLLSYWFRICNWFGSKVSTVRIHRRTNIHTHIFAPLLSQALKLFEKLGFKLFEYIFEKKVVIIWVFSQNYLTNYLYFIDFFYRISSLKCDFIHYLSYELLKFLVSHLKTLITRKFLMPLGIWWVLVKVGLYLLQ